MSDSLIEQVKRLAEAQKCGALFEKLTRIENGIYVPTRFYFDFPALLAHMQAQQAVVDAARLLARHLEFAYGPISPSISPTKVLVCELNAALEKVKDHEQ